MASYRLPYKFLFMFLIFSLALVMALSVITYYGSNVMVRDIEKLGPVSSEQRAVYEKYLEDITENLISLSFYVFVLAFILSLFFSRRFMTPLKELHRGAMSIRDGKLDVRLDVTASDELGEVTKVFNEMAEALKRKTDELMRKDLYINTMMDPLWIVDEDNVVIDVNPAFTKLFGYERDDVIGSPIFDFLDSEAEKVMRSQLQQRGKGQSSTYEISIISKTEGLIPVLITGTPIVDKGEVVGKIGIIKDFRRETSLREALKEEKDYSLAIMDSMTDPLLVVDRDYRIVQANMAARINAGEDIIGQSCHKIYHRTGDKCFLRGTDCPVRVVFETGKSFGTVHEHHEGSKKIYREIISYPVKDRFGDVKHAVEVMRDVTERKRFEEEIEHRNRELTTLNSIAKVLGQSLRAEDIFNGVLDKVISLIKMDGGGIFFLDDMGRELRCKYHKGLSEDFIKSAGRLKIGDDIPGRVAMTGQAIISPDISKDTRGEKSILRYSGIKGYAAIPIRGKEKLLGVFYIFSFNRHIFTAEEERTLGSLSEMMGIAFENIRLYEKMRDMYDQQRQRRIKEQQNSLKLSNMLASTLDLKSVLASSLSLIKDSCGADFAWLLEPDESGNLRVVMSSTNGIEAGRVVFTNGTASLEGYAVENRRPVTLSEITSNPRFYLPENIRGYSSACSIPIFIGDRPLGVITLYYRATKGPSQDDIDFLLSVSSMIAVAIERARLYENVIREKGMADTVLKSIADGVMTVDASCRVVSMNKAAENIIGLSREFEGLPCCELFNNSPENASLRLEIGECLYEAMHGNPLTAEADLHTTNGRILYLMLRSAPIFDHEGKVNGVVFVLRDISREREVDRMKTDFVKQVSHAFRTPLSAIVGMTEMILNEDVSGKRNREYLGIIHSESNRLSEMVSSLLDLAKIESGKAVLVENELNLEALISDIKETFDPLIKRKNIRLSSSVEAAVKDFVGDGEKLGLLFRNIVENSLTYSNEGCEVEVKVGRKNDTLIIHVKDSGWGIPDKDKKHIGEKFYRGSNTLSTKGTGLGLSLCREIVKMHGGKINIQSATGKGTSIEVEMPYKGSGV